jgi:UPF0755 protein
MDRIFAPRQMKKTILIILGVLLLLGGVIAYTGYSWVMVDNVQNSKDGTHTIYVKSNWDYDSLVTALYPLLLDYESFDKVARRMNLPNKVIPGKYVFSDQLSNRQLISKFRSGQFQEVKVVLNSSLKRYEILGRIAESLETDSTELATLVNSEDYLKSTGYSNENWPCLFLANTYNFNWATSAEEVSLRFLKENERFWNNKRRKKAARLDLSTTDVVILASIVDAETIMDSEMKTIAGVYLNRLEKKWPLQADPTIRYLLPEGRQRVLNKDLEIESPYNTYINTGLPPGPVLLPSNKAIDAVLDAESHDYMFFCAKADFSGYHAFAKTSSQHNRNAAAYRRELNRRKILK